MKPNKGKLDDMQSNLFNEIEHALTHGHYPKARKLITSFLRDQDDLDVKIFALRVSLVAIGYVFLRHSSTRPLNPSLLALAVTAVALRDSLREINKGISGTLVIAANYAEAGAIKSAARSSAAYAAYAAYAPAPAAYAAAVAASFYARSTIEDLRALSVGESLVTKPVQFQSFDKLEAAGIWYQFLFKPAAIGTLLETPLTSRNKLFESALKIWFNNKDNVKRVQTDEYVNDYLLGAMDGSLEHIGQARLVLLGNGGAGKTSLAKCLHDAPLNGHEDSTPRISVTNVDIKANDPNLEGEGRRDLSLSVWDFGGQVIMHSTHYFFLSLMSTYVIVCNQRANEQPDNWLAMLETRLRALTSGDIGVLARVLVVYTHCEKKAVKSRALWSRQRRIQRHFSRTFELEFKHLDINPKYISKLSECHDSVISKPIKGVIKWIKQSAVREENSRKVLRELPQADAVFERLEKPTMTIGQLTTELGTEARQWVKSFYTAANDQGLFFPEKPVSSEFLLSLNDKELHDFHLVRQRHWLTYGIYLLINSDKVQQQSGLLGLDTLRNELRVGKRKYWCISEGGYAFKTKSKIKAPDKLLETIQYDEDGAMLLRRIIHNYKWGIITHQRHDELLLPLAAALDEPNVKGLHYEMFSDVSEKEECDYLELIFSYAPKDFFFRLVTYVEPHLKQPQNLWRNGVILNFFCRDSDSTFAVIEFEQNILKLKIKGPSRDNFRQLLMTYISDNIQCFLDAKIRFSVHMVERMKFEVGVDQQGVIQHEYRMMDTRMIDALINDRHGLVDQLKRNTLQRGINVTNTFNIQNVGAITQKGGITGDMGVGDNATVQKIQIDIAELTEAIAQDDSLSESQLADLNETIESIKASGSQTPKSIYKKLADELKSVVNIADSTSKLYTAGQKALDVLTPLIGA